MTHLLLWRQGRAPHPLGELRISEGMGAGGVDQVDAFVGRSPEPGARFRLANLPAAVGFVVVVPAYVGSQVADPGLARRPASIGAEIRNGVINIDVAADPGGIRKYVGGITQLELLAEPGRDRRLHLVRLAPGGERRDLAVLPAESDGAPLQWLNGIAAGPAGSIYYSENASVRRIDANGAITTVASRIGVPDCDALQDVPADFTPYLRGLAVAADGTVYAAANGCRAVVRIGADGAATTVLRAEAPFSPTAVALGGGDLYALEYLHLDHEPRDRKEWVPRVRKLAADGTWPVTTTMGMESM